MGVRPSSHPSSYLPQRHRVHKRTTSPPIRYRRRTSTTQPAFSQAGSRRDPQRTEYLSLDSPYSAPDISVPTLLRYQATSYLIHRPLAVRATYSVRYSTIPPLDEENLQAGRSREA